MPISDPDIMGEQYADAMQEDGGSGVSNPLSGSQWMMLARQGANLGNAINALWVPENMVQSVNGATLQGNWVAFGSGHRAPYYYKIGSRVTLSGLVKHDPVVPTLPSLLFTLPSGYRPNLRLVFPAWGSASGGERTMRLDVYADGGVYLQSFGGSTGAVNFLSLDGITFDVGF